MKTLIIFSFVFGLLFLNVRCEWCLEDQICVELNDLVIRFITSSDPEDCLELCQTYQSEKCEFWTWWVFFFFFFFFRMSCWLFYHLFIQWRDMIVYLLQACEFEFVLFVKTMPRCCSLSWARWMLFRIIVLSIPKHNCAKETTCVSHYLLPSSPTEIVKVWCMFLDESFFE